MHARRTATARLCIVCFALLLLLARDVHSRKISGAVVQGQEQSHGHGTATSVSIHVSELNYLLLASCSSEFLIDVFFLCISVNRSSNTILDAIDDKPHASMLIILNYLCMPVFPNYLCMDACKFSRFISL